MSSVCYSCPLCKYTLREPLRYLEHSVYAVEWDLSEKGRVFTATNQIHNSTLRLDVNEYILFGRVQDP